MSVGVGDRAPDFELPGTSGERHSLSQFAGRPVVLVFYPGDDTPVCTRQLTSYNDGLGRFDGLGATVLGISPQDIDSHERFAAKHGFSFPLLADTDKSVASLYGTLGPLGFRDAACSSSTAVASSAMPIVPSPGSPIAPSTSWSVSSSRCVSSDFEPGQRLPLAPRVVADTGAGRGRRGVRFPRSGGWGDYAANLCSGADAVCSASTRG
ncbi:MAG: peroxiredoxin [Ilumatobacteraceae bacterium]